MTIEDNMQFRIDTIKYMFKIMVGYDLDLENPKTYNEKLQWLKLYYHDPLMTKCSDKYLAREYVKETIGEEYLIPLIGVWNRVEDIDFDKLPNQFVLKVNWGSGQNIIVKDKTQLDIEEAKNKLRDWMHPVSNHYYYFLEWPYKNIEPKIICEKYIEQSDGNLFDYKIFCFHGEPKFIFFHSDRFTNHTKCVYDINWNKLDVMTGVTKHYDGDIHKPKSLDSLLFLSKKLSSDFIHISLDFYCVDNKIYMGEFSVYPDGGLTKFKPEKYDLEFGNLIKLPDKIQIEYDVLDKESILKQAANLEPISLKCKELEYNLTCKDNFIKEKDLIIDELSNKLLNLKEKYNNLINKIAWWIPIRKYRDNFRSKFNIEK